MVIPDGWKALPVAGLWSAIGPLLARRDGEGWIYGLATDDRHANPIGLIHGGTLTALMDHAMTLVAFAACDRTPALTVQMETRFLSAARPGDLLVARSTLDRRAGTTLFLSCRVGSGETVVAAGSALMKLRPERKEDKDG